MSYQYKHNKHIYLNKKKAAFNIAIIAVRSLYKEISLSYKPGLVSFEDSGSHTDMDAKTFIKSIFSLRNYFKKIALAGINAESFKSLQILGLEAEKNMLKATLGINTHKGAIFSLGILCAAVGLLYGKRMSINAKNLSSIISFQWGKDILQNNENVKSNGLNVKKKYGYQGARYEAANGFLSISELALPYFKSTLDKSDDENNSLIQTLFILMKNIDDTNVLHRGGEDGLEFVKNSSSYFLKNGGVFNKNWKDEIKSLHRKFISKNISPGGSADLLALCYFVFKIEKESL